MGFKENPENCNRNGRLVGSKNKITRDIKQFIQKLMDCFSDDDIENLAKWVKTGNGKTAMFRLIGSIAPKDINLDGNITTNKFLEALENVENTNNNGANDVESKAN